MRPFRCPGGRVWGEGGGCFFAGARACACGAREGWKRLVYLDASLSPSLVLVLLAKPYGPVPRITPSLRTFRGSLRSRQEALGTASPPPGSPGARNGRAADSERAIQEERRACLQRLRQLTGSPHTHPGRPTSSRRPPLPARALRHSFGDARKRALSPTRRAAAPRRSARPGARAARALSRPLDAPASRQRSAPARAHGNGPSHTPAPRPCDGRRLTHRPLRRISNHA